MKAFISYSHKDAAMAGDFRQHLNVVTDSFGFRAWIDEEIRPGDKWDGKIRQALAEAQLFLFCVSAAFLNSKYIKEVELVKAREKHQLGEALVIPIIFKPCAWDFVDFLKELQGLPPGAKPISRFNPHANGHEVTARAIGNLLKERLKTGSMP